MNDHKPEFVCECCGKTGDDQDSFAQVGDVENTEFNVVCNRCFNDHVFEGPDYDSTGRLVWFEKKET